jgi:hypothetical protein
MTASDPQRRLAASLYREREIPDEVWEDLQTQMDDRVLMPRAISRTFDAIIRANYPRRGRGEAAAPSAGWPDWSDVQGTAPCSYALPTGCVPEETFRRLAGRHGEAEFIFFEVKQYRGRWYCKRLQGAPGRFARLGISAADQRVLHEFLVKDPKVQENASVLFGRLYKCCGVCKAELTDDYSREVQMGPHCRKTRYGHTR